MSDAAAPLIAHVVHRLGTGGMENGLVNIINRIPPARYRHAIVSLTDASDFAQRIRNPEVRILTLHTPAGHSFGLYARLWRVLRELRPSIVHTRNLAALEAQIPAALLPGVRRVHGEHGRDVFDLHGRSRKYNLLRRAIRPLVHRYIAVSRDLAEWLGSAVGVAPRRIRQIYNGVDSGLFHPRTDVRKELSPPGFLPRDALVVGTVGRLAAVKDQRTLVDAFALLRGSRPDQAGRLRLVIAGDGPDRAALEARVRERGLAAVTWLAGERDDIPQIMRFLDVFVLPSLGEGISNTVLEAMASGLPVVATRVGGNPELVEEGGSGFLVPPGDPAALAQALHAYLDEPRLIQRHGAGGRGRVRDTFNWDRCVEEYLAVYDDLLGRAAQVGVSAA